MGAVPGVEGEGLFEAAGSELGVDERALPLFV
jgi:hypothetical protein